MDNGALQRGPGATAEACSWSALSGSAGPRARQQLTPLTALPLGLLGSAKGAHRCVGPNVGLVPTGMMGIWNCLVDAAQMWPLTGAQGPVRGPDADLCKDRPRESSGVFSIKRRKQRIRPAATKAVRLLPGCPKKFEDFRSWGEILTKKNESNPRHD